MTPGFLRTRKAFSSQDLPWIKVVNVRDALREAVRVASGEIARRWPELR